jgi:predicted dehydrogenase/nucleoside-diphosphate-sugar epimerase
VAIKQSRRLAIIGCGSLVEYGALPALRRIGWLPSVLVDTSSQRVDLIASKMGRKGQSVVKASNWQSVAGEFDVALVALPHTLHGPIGTALAQAGKSVFMEKPLATTGDQGRAMIAAADRSSVILSVGLLRRYLDGARWIKALLHSGTLGTIKHFEAREGFVFVNDTSSEALIRPELSGGGVLMDTGVHTLDLLLWWFDDVEPLSYRDDNEGGVEANCVLDCRLASGASGRVEISRTRDLKGSIYIEGTHGFVESYLDKNGILRGSPNALAFEHNGLTPSTIKPQIFPDLFDAELKDFRTSVSGGDQVGISARDALRSVELIEKCYQARESLALPWVKLESSHLAGPSVSRQILPAASKVLVTGATGFIGGRLAEQLLFEQGAEVRCFIRNTGRATRLARLPVQIQRGDLSNPDDISKAVKGMDYVLHCAYDVRSYQKNEKAVQNIIEACAAHSVRRFVNLSSFSVYEPFPDGPITEETHDGDRTMAYVNNRLLLESKLFELARQVGVEATIVQPSIVYGAYCKPWTNVPAEMLIYGDVILPDRGEGLCNGIYIDDLTDGILLAAISPAAVGERFIMSGPEPVTWATFFTAFANALGTNPPKYWPREQIEKSNRSAIRNIALVLSNPKHLIKLVASWKPARSVLDAAIDAMPGSLRTHSLNWYFNSPGRRIGEVFVPNKQTLALYSSKGVAGSEKARVRLGYKPRFNFERGMALTSEYLRWAYGDIVRSVAARRHQPLKTDRSASTQFADTA